MKKIISILILITLVYTWGVGVYAANQDFCDNGCCELPIETTETQFRNMVVTLIYPHVQKAIGDYYDEYMSYLPGEDPFSYQFISIEKVQNYTYIVIVEVHPYVGPHISAGKDRITLKIDLNGVKIEKFEHLESYKLPSHYGDIFKKPLP